tara:strand:+ start:11217 stop:11966 length:750 start_codon:yes stop_codon:yes gene_type:complete
MKKIIGLLCIIISFLSCIDEKDCCVNFEPVNVTLKFTQNWDGVPLTSADFNDFKFTTQNGESISINRLRYLLSNISIGNTIKDYHLINSEESFGSEIILEQIPQGSTFLKFTFGFADLDNTDGIYQDLNSVSFNVPAMLGGGYHYMQFDGKYKNNSNQDANFNYHTIRAVNKTDSTNLIFQDTSFEVHLGIIEIKDDTSIEIKMNIAEWFKNPNTWNLNELNSVLMPNFEAQKMMSANGTSVFSLGEIN